MSGFKNFFKGSSKTVTKQPEQVSPNQISSYGDGEDLYESIDNDVQKTRPEQNTAHDCDYWSENEFDDVEDIYFNDNQFAPAREVVDPPKEPPLPPRPRGRSTALENSVPSLPPRSQKNLIQSNSSTVPPPVPDYKKSIKQQPTTEDSSGESESYEDIEEEILQHKKKPEPRKKSEHDSESESYEYIEQKETAPSKQPPTQPALPGRGNRTRTLPPTPAKQQSEDSDGDYTAPDSPESTKLGIFSKLTSILKPINQPKKFVESRPLPEVPKGAGERSNHSINDESDLYEDEDFTASPPPLPSTTTSQSKFSRPSPKFPAYEEERFPPSKQNKPLPTQPDTIDQPEDEDTYEIEDEPAPPLRSQNIQLKPTLPAIKGVAPVLDPQNTFVKPSVLPGSKSRIIPSKLDPDKTEITPAKKHVLPPYTPVVLKKKSREIEASAEKSCDKETPTPISINRLKPVKSNQPNLQPGKSPVETKLQPVKIPSSFLSKHLALRNVDASEENRKVATARIADEQKDESSPNSDSRNVNKNRDKLVEESKDAVAVKIKPNITKAPLKPVGHIKPNVLAKLSPAVMENIPKPGENNTSSIGADSSSLLSEAKSRLKSVGNITEKGKQNSTTENFTQKKVQDVSNHPPRTNRNQNLHEIQKPSPYSRHKQEDKVSKEHEPPVESPPPIAARTPRELGAGSAKEKEFISNEKVLITSPKVSEMAKMFEQKIILNRSISECRTSSYKFNHPQHCMISPGIKVPATINSMNMASKRRSCDEPGLKHDKVNRKMSGTHNYNINITSHMQTRKLPGTVSASNRLEPKIQNKTSGYGTCQSSPPKKSGITGLPVSSKTQKYRGFGGI